MKKVFLTIILIAIAVSGVFFAVKQNSSSHKDADKLQATASFYPLYEFTKAVGGNVVQVNSIVPAGTEPHSYEPSAKALAEAKAADIFVYMGAEFEPWADKFTQDYEGANLKVSDLVELIQASEEDHEPGHDHDHGHADPHFWLDPVLVQQVVSAIAQSLGEADPSHAATYAANAAAYNKKLAQLNTEFTEGLAHCQQNTIIATHDAYHYLADRYNFTVESIAGINPEEEPSAAHIAQIADSIRMKNISYIFFESLVSARLADTISQETGAKTLVLDPIEGVQREDQEKGRDYFAIQRENLANLRKAMACQ